MPSSRAPALAAALLLAACSSAPPPPAAPPPAAPCPPCPAAPLGPLRFRVSVAPDRAHEPVSGRVLVLMSRAAEKKDVLELGFGDSDPAFASAVVDALAPGAPVEIDPDRLAAPGPLSHLPSGHYQMMAILDPDGSFPRAGRDAGDLYGPVVEATIDPAHAGTIDLMLDKRTPDEEIPTAAGVTPVTFQSPALTAFFMRPTEMHAFVVLPPGDAGEPAKRRFPTAYMIPGFGSSRAKLARRAAEVRAAMAASPFRDLAFVVLEGAVPSGHHVFADSVNTGPWGRALVDELIPYLEAHFPLSPRAGDRFVTGHSSGGWASLWLQITHPDTFGGVWSTSPDPVDFHHFLGVDVTPGSTDNMYFAGGGKPRNLFRDGGKDLVSVVDFVHAQQVEGGRGGPLSTFDWVFSPRGPDGQPLPLFDHRTGALNPEVQTAWARYDIHATLKSRWKSLGPKLAGKLHLYCGGADSFHLEEAVISLCDFLKEKGSDATCEILPGKGHFDLYGKEMKTPGGLFSQIVRGMVDRARSKR